MVEWSTIPRVTIVLNKFLLGEIIKMARVIMTVEVENGSTWESAFRTHDDVIKAYGLRGPVEFSISGNEVAICFDPADTQKFLQIITEPQTAEAMKSDGVKRETLKVYVLDKIAF
jgi:hypothetical protein